MHHGFKIATTQVLAELFNQQTLVVVTGEAGLGKTLLLAEIGRVLRAAGWHVALAAHAESWLTESDPRPPTAGPVAVLIDGHGLIMPVQIQRLLRLPNLAIVMALRDTAETRLPASAPVRLAPMSLEASTQYLSAWLQQTGARPDLLDAPGIAHLVARARGVPRTLSALLEDLAKQPHPSAQPFSPADVDQAARRLQLPLDAIPPVLDCVPPPRPAFDDVSPHPTMAFDPDPPEAPGTGLRRLIPTHPGSAALVGLLCGILAAIAALLLQDLPQSLPGNSASAPAAAPSNRRQ